MTYNFSNRITTSCDVKFEQVPSLRKIQETLVQLEDKPKRFVGSRDWIGSFEVFYSLCLQSFLSLMVERARFVSPCLCFETQMSPSLLSV